MKVWIQGQEKQISEGLTLEALLKELNLTSNFIATAVNESFVPRAKRSEVFLSEGDRIEMLSPQQGG